MNGNLRYNDAGIAKELAIKPKITSNGFGAANGTSLTQKGSHRPLTVLRAIRGLCCLFILVSTAFIMMVFLAPICCVLVRLVSVYYSRKLVAFFFGRWLSMWAFLFEVINKTKVIFSGDKLPTGERAVIVCNHTTEVDWLYIWNLALRKGRIGDVKYIVKSSVRNAPLFGWALHAMEFLLIDRKWESDEAIIHTYLSSFEHPSQPLWLILFPEGTDFTEEKKKKSQKYAQAHGLPKLEHVLLPRTKAFDACMSHLRDSLDAVYDLTIAYKYRCPLFIDNLCGTDPAEVHIHVRRVRVEEIPYGGEEQWLYDSYESKDELLGGFVKRGRFNGGDDECVEGGLCVWECAVNICGILFGCAWLWGIVLFGNVMSRVFVVLSCAYMVTATYFDWRPRHH